MYELNLLVQYPVTAAKVNKLVPTMKDGNNQVLDTTALSQEKSNKGMRGYLHLKNDRRAD